MSLSDGSKSNGKGSNLETSVSKKTNFDEFQYKFKIENVRLINKYNLKKPYEGNLYLTTSHMVFKDPTTFKEIWLLYSHISSVEKLSLTTRGSPLLIRCKTFLCLTFVIPRDRDAHDVCCSLQQLSNPSSIDVLYCFRYTCLPDVLPKTAGWNFYDLQAEYNRMRVPNNQWSLTTLNRRYELCDSYPSYLYVPAAATAAILLGSSKFRSKGRLPVLSYLHKNNAAICRCSQPLSGFNARCLEDETLLNNIVQTNSERSYMYVVDTRPKINAMANRAAGKGYENENFYENIKFKFFGIENIHVMRNSLSKLIEACDFKTSGTGMSLFGVDASGWLRHIKALLDTAKFIAQVVASGVSVVVHCSDGWDRTAQVCSLASILLDPFYRTIQGYQALIEKDWLSFGHKFTDRYALVSSDAREVSPIFTQFVEATHHLCVRYPKEFQFNERYLLNLHDHTTSCQYGTFIGNCERERHQLQLSSRTFSYWGHVANNMDDFMNPFYAPNKAMDMLDPDLSSQNFTFWRGMYCRYENGVHPKENLEEMMLATVQHNSVLEDHIEFLQKMLEKYKKESQPDSGNLSSVEKFLQTSLVDKIKSISINPTASDTQKEKNIDTVDDLTHSVADAHAIALNWKSLRKTEKCKCQIPFDYSTKMNHCRCCGSIFCQRCMRKKPCSLPGLLNKKMVTVCKKCYRRVSGAVPTDDEDGDDEDDDQQDGSDNADRSVHFDSDSSTSTKRHSSALFRK